MIANELRDEIMKFAICVGVFVTGGSLFTAGWIAYWWKRWFAERAAGLDCANSKEHAMHFPEIFVASAFGSALIYLFLG